MKKLTAAQRNALKKLVTKHRGWNSYRHKHEVYSGSMTVAQWIAAADHLQIEIPADTPEPEASKPQAGEAADLSPLGRRIQRATRLKSWSQSDLARAMFGTMTDNRGYDVAKGRDRISNYMSGKTEPNYETIMHMARVLEVPVESLLPPRPTDTEISERCSLRNMPGTQHFLLDLHTIVHTDLFAEFGALIQKNRSMLTPKT